MGSKISADDFIKRLHGRSIKVLRYGGRLTAKSEFMCEKGHIWTTTGTSVAGGTGCLVCCGKKEIDVSKAKLDLEKRGIILLEATGRSIDPAYFRCVECGHAWKTNLGAVCRGGKCKNCLGLVKRTLEEASDLIKDRGLNFKVYCGSTSGKSIFSCKCGNEWTTTLASILTGRGCPKCAKYGFDKTKPAIFYVYEINGNENFIGYGITNSYKSRRERHASTFRKEGLVFKEIFLVNFSSGSEALNLESIIKERYKNFRVKSSGFKTEAAPLTELIKILGLAVEAKEKDFHSQNKSSLG